MKVRAAVTATGAAIAATVLVLTSANAPRSGPGAAWAAPGHQAAGAGCDHDGVQTALRTAFDPAVGYTVVAVAVDGIAWRCSGHRLSVALTDESGAVSAQGGPLVVPPGGRELTVAVPPVAAASAARVHALLE